MVEQGVLSGRLLVASSALTDATFARSVVLVLAHTHEGALGVVLNRPGGLSVDEVLPRWTFLAAAPSVVFIGGPVAPDTALCLGATTTGWRVVDTDEDPGTADVRQVRVFGAYSGWSALQLEAEVAAGGWYVVDSRVGDVFTSEPSMLWRRVLRRQGGRIALASTAPDDPRMN